jgi:5,5'-dehydrodivanillate O-demethylase
MMQSPVKLSRSQLLSSLTTTGSESDMGKLLRQFWHPVALSDELKVGETKLIRLLSEDFTLFRGQSGQAFLVGPQCRHRLTALHTGWVEGDSIRCIYHGWRFNGQGQCVERPAEKDENGIPGRCHIPGYAVHEYSGMVFVYIGPAPVPDFDLPRKDCLEHPDALIFCTQETWEINWFQQVENSLDPVHVSFVHRALRVDAFANAVTNAIPELSYAETEAGIEQTAKRSEKNIRKSNWTFPNNNHVVVPGLGSDDAWIDFIIWMVPADDRHSTRFTLYVTRPRTQEERERLQMYFSRYGGQYNADEHYRELFHERKGPAPDDVMGLISAQDYLAQRGQGVIANRENELLASSDLGVMTLRRIFWRELECIREGKPTKSWRKREVSAVLPQQPGHSHN